MKVALCTPVYGETKALFTYSLVGMVLWSQVQNWNYNGVSTKPAFTRHMMFGLSQVHRAREQIAADAIGKDVDFLLWLDSDQTFPQDTLYRLAKANKPIVGCNYRKRTAELVISTAARRVDGKLEPITPKVAGVEQVDALGLGICLVRAEVFRKTPAPWFRMTDEGEDAYFCEHANEHGFPSFVDHALSNEVGHIAETVLTFPP